MNENNKCFYPSDMFEFIHHLEHGCPDLKGLNLVLEGSSKNKKNKGILNALLVLGYSKAHL
jgi:hypothetical protein